MLLGCTRQGYYQGIKHTQQKTYEAEIIIAEVLKYRVLQKHLGARKLLGEMGVFLQKHGFQIGRDTFFKLLLDRGLLVVKRKRKICIKPFLGIGTRSTQTLSKNSYLWQQTCCG